MSGAFREEDPDTSKDAAGTVNAGDLEQIVLTLLERWGPSTTHELADMSDIQLVSISPRIAPLRRKGLVEASGVRRAGSTVWRLT